MLLQLFQMCFEGSISNALSSSSKALNKLVRQLKLQPVKLHIWPLTGPLKIIGFLDASYRNNEEGSSQKDMTVFLAELQEQSSKDGMSYRSLVDYESQKMKRTVLSTTVTDLYSFMKCFGSCQFFRDCGWTCQVRLQNFT